MTETAKNKIVPTGIERFFREGEVIVSKTDLKGRLTYVNRVFINLSGYSERELLGRPHSLIRHPEMPRSVFKLLWDRIGTGHEIFAYVNNMSKNGDNYWVLAHVTPSYDKNGKIIGYHSNRRVPGRHVLDATIIPLYKQLLDEENRYKNAKDGMNNGFEMLEDIIRQKGMSYDEFIFALQRKAV
ncbi:MAG: PAS domain-containing protein [Micavibrio aeruginosavorus]|uniref:PAS domain-containing protein n=1 Tax=Micavibrio aeruginosavorus TaxID=349221 RepID=A0A7T5UIK1_9BACT|nr:MAG: PAS domain-containing protein [Micavibrio aeruginosavorus]